MPDIRYVCLSDMHLGEEDSVLTNTKKAKQEPDPSEPSPVLSALAKCLRYLIERNEGEVRPTLILNGDILELALSLTNQTAMAFERFMETLKMPDGKLMFENIIYIPGNHDHHIWEIARETQYVHYIEKVQPFGELAAPCHTTNMFYDTIDEMLPVYFLTNLVQRHEFLKNFEIKIAYPNFGLRLPDGKKCVIFHHGHFTEPIYKLMSKLFGLLFNRDMPSKIELLEAENFAWIDFFWSTLGRSGQAGAGVESIYEHMLHPLHFKKLLSQFSRNLAKEYDLPGWGDYHEEKILEQLLHWAASYWFNNRERTQTGQSLSEEAEKSLWDYMKGSLKNQLLEENGGKIPEEVSLVFGHTHKPFQQDLQFDEYPDWVDVYNTGGWVVDSVEREPKHGAAVVLCDENLNLTSLRMYNESEDSQGYQLRIKQASHAGQKPNAFHDRIVKMMKKKPKAFVDFAQIVERTVYIRAQKLRSRLKKL